MPCDLRSDGDDTVAKHRLGLGNRVARRYVVLYFCFRAGAAVTPCRKGGTQPVCGLLVGILRPGSLRYCGYNLNL